jgi:PncC family amidohydrolase
MAEDQIEILVGELLRSQGLTLAVAESCTGGLLGHRLTNVPGSSDYFVGGMVAYSYDVKERVLGVLHNTLYDHGAVSEKTALEMAQSARRLFATDLALSVTGIAGPGGAMADKPVGLVYIALSTQDQQVCHKFVWESDREGNKACSAQAALEMLLTYLRERGQTVDNTWLGDQEVAVEAQFQADGEIQPTAFTWRGSRRTIAGLGRQWDESDGRHVLVEATDGSRFELCLTSADHTWRLKRAWERSNLV